MAEGAVVEPVSEQATNNSERRSGFLGGRLARLLVILVVLVALGVGGYAWWVYSSSFESTDDAEVDGHIYPVSSRISGTVVEVKVENNQRVGAGQLLVRLDPADYDVAIQQAEARVAQSVADAQAAQTQVPITSTSTSSQISSATAAVEDANAGILVAERQYEAAQARVREAQANYVKAQKDVERYRPLVEKDEISKQQFDQAIAAAEASAATVESAKASAAAVERQVNQARARLAEARAQEESTRSTPQQIAAQRARATSSRAEAEGNRAALEQAKLNRQYTLIVAPVAGVVGKRAVEVGQQVQTGQELLSVTPLERLWITANFKETQLRKMRIGQRVDVHVDSTGGDYKGHIESFPAATGAKYSLLPPENATGNFVKVVQRLPVRIFLEPGEDKDHLLRPGMSCEPKVWLK